MAQYPQLAGLVRTIDPRSPDDSFTRKVVPYLVNVWLDDYSRNGTRRKLLKRPFPNFLTYLILPLNA